MMIIMDMIILRNLKVKGIEMEGYRIITFVHWPLKELTETERVYTSISFVIKLIHVQGI